MGDDFDKFVVTAEELYAHSARVYNLSELMGEAWGTVSSGALTGDAYGLLGTPLSKGIIPAQESGLHGLGSAASALRGISRTIKENADAYVERDERRKRALEDIEEESQ